MNGFVVGFISIVLGWIREVFYFIWQIFSLEKNSFFINLIIDNWILIVILLCAIGLFLDWLVYIVRWKPYYVWIGKKAKQTNNIDENIEFNEKEYYFDDIENSNNYDQNFFDNHQEKNIANDDNIYYNDEYQKDYINIENQNTAYNALNKEDKKRKKSILRKIWIELFKDDEIDDEEYHINSNINPDEAFDNTKIK